MGRRAAPARDFRATSDTGIFEPPVDDASTQNQALAALLFLYQSSGASWSGWAIWSTREKDRTRQRKEAGRWLPLQSIPRLPVSSPSNPRDSQDI